MKCPLSCPLVLIHVESSHTPLWIMRDWCGQIGCGAEGEEEEEDTGVWWCRVVCRAQ